MRESQTESELSSHSSLRRLKKDEHKREKRKGLSGLFPGSLGMEPPPREGVGDPAASASANPTTGRTEAVSSPFLQADAADSSAASKQVRASDHSDEEAAATAIDVGKPLPKSVAPLHAAYDSSGTDSDSSFGSRLLYHEGALQLEFFVFPSTSVSLNLNLLLLHLPLQPPSGEETFGLQITREVEITNDEFEWLATGEVPQQGPGGAPLLFSSALSRRRRQRREGDEAAASAAAQHRQQQQQQRQQRQQEQQGANKKKELGGKHRHLFATRFPTRHGGGHPHSEEGHEGRGDDDDDDYAYSSYYRKQAEIHATAEARKAERRNRRGTGLFAPWGRAATSAREPYALFDPRKEATATRLFRGRSLLLLPLVHPHSLLSRIERMLVGLLDCTYSAFVVPIAIAYVPSKEYSFWSGEEGETFFLKGETK